MSIRSQAVGTGGLSAIHHMATKLGLPREIDRRLTLLKLHKPYLDSDHVLTFAYNALAGGTCIEDLERLRTNEAFLDSLGAARIPDPTTAGDYCRRFTPAAVDALQDAIHEVRLRVWVKQREEFFRRAIVDADGTAVTTKGECKEGMALNYEGEWGFHPLVMSLANTGEVLFLVNRSGNRPSHEGAAQRFDQLIPLLRRAGFQKILFRGDSDFSQTQHLDRWHDQRVGFVFGFDARNNVEAIAEKVPHYAWKRLVRRSRHRAEAERRTPRENHKDAIVRERGYKNLRLQREDVAEFEYQPTACVRPYRMVVLRKTITVQQGQREMFPEVRYFFYLTNLEGEGNEEVVALANDRCNQENLHAQLKEGVHALRAPVDSLTSNWAYMVMTALAWNLKAWFALLLPVPGSDHEQHREERRRLLTMEFRTFLQSVVHIPAQVVRTGRQVVLRMLSYNRWLTTLFRAVDFFHCLRC